MTSSLRVRRLQPDDLDPLIRIRRASFGSPSASDLPRVRAIFEGRLPHLRGAWVEDRLVAACTWYPKVGWIGGQSVNTGALASVVSAPEARRRGHVRTLIQAGLEELHEHQVGWSGEHPFDPVFYERMGYRSIPTSTLLRLPFARLPASASRTTFAPVGIEDAHLHATYRAFAASRSFTFDRDDPTFVERDDAGIDARWSDLLDPPASGAPAAVPYACEDGYAIVAVDGHGSDGILHVIDATWSSPAGRRNVLDMLRVWEGQAGSVQLELPTDDPLALREASAYARHRAPYQIRIVSVVPALAPLCSPSDGAATWRLRLVDPLAPWNAGSWRLTLGKDGTEVTPTTGAPDVTMAVGALAALLSGVAPATLLATGEAEGSLEALHALHALTRDQPPYLGLADYF